MLMKHLFTLLFMMYAANAAFSQVPERFRVLQNVVSATQLKQTVEQLVAFGTRHTLSDTTSRQRGIGAARRWAYQQLKSYSPACVWNSMPS